MALCKKDDKACLYCTLKRCVYDKEETKEIKKEVLMPDNLTSDSIDFIFKPRKENKK